MGRLTRGAALLMACCVMGCNAVGPKALRGARLDYNDAIAETWNEQLLRNLVRLKYRDTIVFLEVTSISTQYSASYSAGVSPRFIGSGAGDELEVDAGISFSERPTVTYAPLQGQEFVTQLLSPIPLNSLILLSQSGWSIRRVLSTCVQRMNDLDNASAASGPTPIFVPVYRPFARAVGLLRQLQIEGDLSATAGGGEEGDALMLRISESASHTDAVKELRRLLAVPEDVTSFEVTDGWRPRVPGRLALQTRSLLGVLHFLSNAVDVPEAHRRAGWVVTTRDEEGERFFWSELTKDLLTIHSAQMRPENAFVATKYRGVWFYIKDNDLNSKATFGFLTYLFYLQTGEIKSFGPTLTLPVGQ